MKNTNLFFVMLFAAGASHAQQTNNATPERVAEFIHWYPAIEQGKMRDQ